MKNKDIFLIIFLFYLFFFFKTLFDTIIWFNFKKIRYLTFN